MQFVAVILGFLLLVSFSGCSAKSNRENFAFIDSNNLIKNDDTCLKLCKERESFGGTYVCDYEPVICEKGVCLCKTY